MDMETAGTSDEGALGRQHALDPQTVYSLRAFTYTDPFDDGGGFCSPANLALLLPIYLLPNLFLRAPYGQCLYCLELPLLLCAFNTLPKPATALVHLVTVPLFGLLPPSQVAERYLSVEVLAAALALFLVVGLDNWSKLVACTAHTVCARYGLRRGQLFLKVCALSFAYALIVPDTVVAVTLVYFLDRVCSTIYKEDMDRPFASAARASSLQASQSPLHLDSVSQPSLARLENEALLDRITDAVDSRKMTDSKKLHLSGPLTTTSAVDCGASDTTAVTSATQGAREVDLATVTSIPADANANESSHEHNIAKEDTEESRATHAQAGSLIGATAKQSYMNQAPPAFRDERSFRFALGKNEDAFNAINPFSPLEKQATHMETTGMVPNTQQPSQSNPHGSPTTMSGGRIDSGLTPRTHISEPEPLQKPTDNGRSFPLPERGMHFSRKFSIADALDRRHSSTSSFNRQEEQLKASEDLEVGGTSGARSSSCESTTVTERDHALNIGKSSRRTEPAESAGKMAQEASAQDVKLVNSTETADRAIPDGRVYTVGTADRDDGVHPEYLPASVKSSEVTGSSSEHPRNKDELHMQRFDSQLTRKPGAGFVLEASSLDTASSSASSRDDRSLKSRSTSEGTPMPGTDSDIWTRKSGAPNSNGLDPTSKTAAPGATSNSSTLSPMLDLSASDLELLKDKPRYHPTGVTKRKASVNKRFPYFTTDSVEFQEEISKGYDGNAVRFPSKDYDVKVEKKGRVKVNNEEHLKRVTTDGKYGQCQVQCKLSDSNVEVVQTERKNIHEHVDSNAGSEGREIGKNACLIRRKYSPTKMKTERDTGSDDKKLSGKTRTKKGRDPSSKKGSRTKKMTADAPSLIAGNEPTHTKETMELERRPFEASPLANDYCDASVASFPRDTGAHQEARGFQDVALDVKKEPSVLGKSPPSLRAESLDSVKELCELRHGLCNENAIQIPLPSQLLDSPKTEAPTAAPPMKCEREREGTESAKKKTHLKSSKSSSSSTKSARRNSCKASKGSRKRKRIIADATSRISGNQSTDTKETMQQEKIPFETSPFAIYHCEASIAPLPPDTGAHQEASGFQDVALDVEREPTFTAKSSPSSMAESLDSVKESRELHHRLRNKNAVQLPPHLVESTKPEAPQALSATKCECDTEDAKSVKKKTAKKSSKSSSSSTKSGGRNSCKASKGSRKATKTTPPTEVQIEKGGSEVGGMPQACRPNDPKKAKVGEITPDNKKLRAEDDSKMALLRRPPSIDDAQAMQPLEVKEPAKSEIDKQRKHKGVFEGAIGLQVLPVEDALEQMRPKAADVLEKAEAPNILHLPTTKGPPAYIAPGTVQSASASFSHTSGIMNRGLTGSGTGVSFEIGISKPNKDDSKVTVEKATVALTPSDKACTSARLRRRPTILKTSGAMLAATRSVRHHSAVDFGTTRFTVISPEHKLSRGWSHPLARERTSASTLSSTWDVNTEKPRRSSLSHIMRRRGSSAFEESFSRSTFRPYTTGSQTTYGPSMSTKRVRKDVHTAFLLGPSLVATLGGMCNFFHVGARERALKHVSTTKDRTNLLVTGITWVIVTLPAVFTVAATCSGVVWLLYVKPHEPQPLSSLNERVMSAAEARRAQQTTPRGAYYACTAYAVIFAIAYAPSLLLGVEPRIALLGALVWLVLVTSILTPLLRVTFDFVRSIWQQLPWGVVLFLGATQVASCLLQEYKLVNKLFKLMPDSFWERQSSPGVQALLALFTTVMAEIMDKRALTEVMAPILRHVAEVKGVYPAYFAVPVIMGASSNVVMPASVHLALLHELARVPFWILLLLGLILKMILVSLAIATVHIADKAGFLAPPTLPE